MTLPRDVDDYLPYGKVKDYPVNNQKSSDHFGESITIGSRLSHKLTESELYNVICQCDICKPRFSSYPITGHRSFSERMRYSDWCHHHSAVHPNAPLHFSVVSFWSTCFDGYGYGTEYRLVSVDPRDRELVYLKPLDAIYSNEENAEPINKRCFYCHSTTRRLLRCGGCKVVFYCNTDCQSKHWKLIHKENCKKYREKYKNRALTQRELYDIDRDATVKLSKMSHTYDGHKLERLNEMIVARLRCEGGEGGKKQPELLMPQQGEECPGNIWWTSMMEAFDRDGDGKLCFEEWKALWQTLGFRTIRNIGRFKVRGVPFASWHHFFYSMAADPLIGLLPEHEPSLSNGKYGSYLYPNAAVYAPVLFGKEQIIKTLGYGAFFMTLDPNNEDPDFQKKWNFHSPKATIKKAFTLMSRLLGHAMHITMHGDRSRDQEKVYDAIMEAVPFLDKDTVSIIYDFQSLALCHFLNVSWHRIEWHMLPDDTEGLWNEYDRKSGHQHFDLFYLKKQHETGRMDIFVQIEICDDIKWCNKKLEFIESGSVLGFSVANSMDSQKRRQRWCLGMCPAYIPVYSFVIRDHATFLGKVLKYHNLNPVQCHYIYVGEQLDMSIESKKKIVDEYNAMFGSKTKFRPHHPEKSAGLFGLDPLGLGRLL